MSSKKAAKAAKAAKRQTKLVDAAEVGDVETMARVMSSGGKLDLDVLVAREGWINESTKEALPEARVTALYTAVASKKEAAVRFLLDRGANPNLVNSGGSTPLMAAAVKGLRSMRGRRTSNFRMSTQPRELPRENVSCTSCEHRGSSA